MPKNCRLTKRPSKVRLTEHLSDMSSDHFCSLNYITCTFQHLAKSWRTVLTFVNNAIMTFRSVSTLHLLSWPIPSVPFPVNYIGSYRAVAGVVVAIGPRGKPDDKLVSASDALHDTQRFAETLGKRCTAVVNRYLLFQVVGQSVQPCHLIRRQ